jgi:hydroxyacylglutathione hydrolase
MKEIVPLKSLSDNYIWMITDTEAGICVAFDPGNSASVINFLKKNNLSLSGLLVTHHHYDHTGGINELKETFSVPVYGPRKDNISELTHPVDDKETINFNKMNLSFTVFITPGHTRGHVIYYTDDIKPGCLFTGDMLFSGGCGRIFEGTHEQMLESLKKFKNFSQDTRIFPAHEYTQKNLEFASSIEPQNSPIIERLKNVRDLRKNGKPSVPSSLSDEFSTNPFLRTDCPELKKSVEEKIGSHVQSEMEVFRIIRGWKDKY